MINEKKYTKYENINIDIYSYDKCINIQIM